MRRGASPRHSSVPQSPSQQSIEVTEEKKAALDQEMANFEAVSRVLKDLGDATVKRKGETSQKYLQRLNKIWKAQAYLLHLAHARVESALDAKYQLEADVAEYARWVETLSGRIVERNKQYQADLAALNRDLTETRWDGQVLAYLIATQGGVEKAIQERYAKEYPPDGIQSVPNYQARQEKFLQKPKDKWQSEFRDLVRQVQVKELRRNFLKVRAIPETGKWAEDLPAEHKHVLQEAMEVLQKYTDLETTADKIAVAAEYAQANLEWANTFVEEGRLNVPIEKVEEESRKLEAGLEPIMSPSVTAPAAHPGIMRQCSAGQGHDRAGRLAALNHRGRRREIAMGARSLLPVVFCS